MQGEVRATSGGRRPVRPPDLHSGTAGRYDNSPVTASLRGPPEVPHPDAHRRARCRISEPATEHKRVSTYIVPAIVVFPVSLVAMLAVRCAATRRGWIEQPRADRWHRTLRAKLDRVSSWALPRSAFRLVWSRSATEPKAPSPEPTAVKEGCPCPRPGAVSWCSSTRAFWRRLVSSQ